MASSQDDNQQQKRVCGYTVPTKKRPCRMLVKVGKKFCGEHAVLEMNDTQANGTEPSPDARMPCPYDPKHSCFVSQLERHLAKCNSRPKPQPDYIQKDVNVIDPTEKEIKIGLRDLTDEELVDIIQRVSKIHQEHVGKLPDSFGRHPVLEPLLSSLTESRGSWRHLLQNSAILYNMSECGILTSGDSTTYVEFGSGRGQLGYVIGQAIDLSTDSILMIDRSSPRHKHENRYKIDGENHPSVHRIRSDIADVELARFPHVQQNTRRLVGTGKHLCGAATDLALHCLAKTNDNQAGLVQGISIALCCHHQCTWRHYVGKAFFNEVGLSPKDFAIMKTLTSWATCGAQLQEKEHVTAGPEEEVVAPGRYASLDLSAERREQIGRQCKQIIDQGRVSYLSGWLEARLVHYVEPDVSLENVLLLASFLPQH